ncbi:MAG: phosphatase PAP2 family protein [Rudanella sp.]|nr:phosphatase PAP2 family protein [Rudanella sp.]
MGGKRTFVRARPLAVAYHPETGFSFPSGHSATAMTLYRLLAYWWIRRLSRTRDRVGVGVLASVLIGLVGYSRIYLGVHFLSDVMGATCWAVAGCCWALFSPSGSPANRPARSNAPPLKSLRG